MPAQLITPSETTASQSRRQSVAAWQASAWKALATAATDFDLDKATPSSNFDIEAKQGKLETAAYQ